METVIIRQLGVCVCSGFAAAVVRHQLIGDSAGVA
jgi:hypothetical protein